jgi:NAD-dependent DNA ligase
MQRQIQNFKNKGRPFLDKLSESNISNILKFANDKFFNDTSVLSDNEYDIIKEYMEEKYPNNPILNQIGADVKGKNKVTLPYFMPSMNKIKSDSNSLDNWVKKYKGKYIITPKLDGVSGLYSNETGVQKLYTRGNGSVGQDISHFIPFLNLPNINNVTIRGEFIISKNNFLDNYSIDFSNPRNFVSGIINSKKIDHNKLSHIDFVPYEIIHPILEPIEQLYMLDKHFIDYSIPYYFIDKLSNILLSNNLKYFRENYKYECDGIIVTNNKIYKRQNKNPDHSFAFKMMHDEQIAETKIVHIEWNPSKDGLLKPRVHIEPIQLGGVNINHVTAFNAAFVVKNKLGVGAVVKIIRSGDVIPYIMETISPASIISMPDVEYDWNNTNIDIVIKNKEDDHNVLFKNILGFFTIIGVEGLSKGNIHKLIDNGFNTIVKISNITVEELLSIDGFKEKMANKIYNNINSAIQNATLPKLMHASNIFGHGFGETKFKIILNEQNDILTSKHSKSEKISIVQDMPNMAVKTSSNFVNKIPDFIKFINTMGLQHKLEYNIYCDDNDEDTQYQNHELFKKNIVFTGCRPVQIINTLQDNYKVNIQNNVNKNTYILVCKSTHDNSNKIKDAQSHNVTIMSIEQFTNKINNL